MSSLELLVSPPGTGKTSHCIDLFRKELLKTKGGIDSRSFFVLPSREHAERIQNLLVKKDVPGLFNAHVLTLNDLAAYFSQVEGAPAPSESVRTALLRSILAEDAAAGNLPFFGRVADAKGFARALSSFFSEMRRGLVSFDDLQKWCAPLAAADKVFSLKLRDLSRTAQRYEQVLHERGWAEPEERLKDLVGGHFSAELVLVDGFYHFTRAQLALIEALRRSSKRLIVTLTAPSGSADRPHVFAHAFRTRKDLEALGFKTAAPPSKAPLRASSAALRHLILSLFSDAPARVPAENAVEIVEAPNAREEMRAVARQIRKLYRTGSFHWSDVAVILRTIEPYRKILESAFQEFEIPVHIHERRKLIEQGLAQTAARLLRLIRDDWKEADVAFVARSSCRIPAPQAEAALELVRTARAEGVADGREAWVKFLTNEALADGPKAVLAELFKEEERLRTAKSAGELSRRLRTWLQARRQEDPDELVWRSLEDIFERTGRNEEGEGAFSILYTVEDLLDALEAGLYSEKPRGRNRVQVYDVVMALPKEYKAVFVSGLAEKFFPKETAEEPLLKDAERRAINGKAGRVVFEERAARLSGERYFFYMAVTRAREKLVLTYPAAGLDGRPVLSSLFIEDVRRCFEEKSLRVRRTATETGESFWESSRESASGILSALFRAPQTVSEDRKHSYLGAWVFGDDLKNALSEASRVKDGRIDDAANRRRFAEDPTVFSATSLEALITCPFKYFSAKILGLNASPEDRSAAEQGNVLHKTLETFYRSLTEAERKDAAPWADFEAVAKRIEPFLDKAFSGNPYFRRLPAYRRAVIGEQMKRAIAHFSREEAKLRRERAFIPVYFEEKFGGSVPLDLGGIPVKGFIDRIDVSPDKKTAIVVDYKSSKTNFVKKIAKGLELQMPLYWIAAEKIYGFRVVAAEHRHLKDGKEVERIYRASDRKSVGKEKGGWEEDRLTAELESVRSRSAEAVHALKRSDIAVRPKSCDLCDFSPVCRFEKWKLIYREPS